MLKILLCLVVVASATMVGNWFSVKISRRTKELLAIVEILVKIKNYISFEQSEIQRVVCESFKSAYGFDNFKQQCEGTEDFSKWWQEEVCKLSGTTALNKEDISLLMRFGDKLGVTDLQGQISNCDLYIRLFAERQRSAAESECRNVRLYRVLGFSTGCTVTLMLL